MQTTTNLGLNKPEDSDTYDIGDFNENADKIDTAIGNLQDSVLTHTNTNIEAYVDNGRIVLGVRQFDDNNEAKEQLFFSIVSDKLRVDHMRTDRTWHAITLG